MRSTIFGFVFFLITGCKLSYKQHDVSGEFKTTLGDKSRCLDCHTLKLVDRVIHISCVNTSKDSVYVFHFLQLGYVQHNGGLDGGIKLINTTKSKTVESYQNDIHGAFEPGTYLKKGDSISYYVNVNHFYADEVFNKKYNYAVVIYAPYVFCQDSLVVNIK